MSFNTNITPGRPPLLWSEVNDAFIKINENFDILVATIGDGSGLTPLDFTSLDTSVKPTTDNLYDLGDVTHKWKGVYSGEHTTVDPLNGLWAGTAQIKGVGLTVNLPADSTIGGDPLTGIGTSLIIDPDKTFFKEIQVDNDLSVVATTFGDTLNLLSGSGISLTVSSSADSIEIDNTGILSVTAGSGMSVSTVSGTATIINSGVRSLQSVASLPSGRTAGSGININGSTGDNLKITNTGVISISSGVGITVSLDAATGDVTVTNSAPAVNAFTQIEVNSDNANRLQADAVSDVLYINSGEGITLTKNTSTDTLTITVNPTFDLKGSIFGDDSSILVDAVSNYIYGNVSATTLRTAEAEIRLGFQAGSISQAGSTVAVGANAGYDTQSAYGVAVGANAGKTTQALGATAVGYTAAETNQGDSAVAIGRIAGRTNQGASAVAVGYGAGATGQGANAVAIGMFAGYNSQTAGSIAINATGVILNPSTAGFYVDPIRSTANGTPLMYNSTTKELFYSTVLEFAGSRISTSDSSGLTVDVQTTFNTDVTFENDLYVTQQLRVQGSRVINLSELKSVVAASTSFSDFQSRIAALV